ncbi:MAG: hypothetical protein ACW98D_02050 [Promethearchaeota archaeon]|jgi:hypothetical protein
MTVSKEISKEKWTVERLKKMSREELLELYKTLPSPDFEEMDGEFDGHTLDTGSEMGNQMSEWVMNKTAMGVWKGKAYTPSTSTTGEGYNRYVIDGKERHHLRFGTDMNVSLFDGKPTLRMRYGAFKNVSARNDLIDEVRKLDEGIYLCTGAALDAKGKRGPPTPFCLTGPIREYDHETEFYFGDEVKEQAVVPFDPNNRFNPKK